MWRRNPEWRHRQAEPDWLGQKWSYALHLGDISRINRRNIVQDGGPWTITPAFFGIDAFSIDKIASRGDQNWWVFQSNPTFIMVILSAHCGKCLYNFPQNFSFLWRTCNLELILTSFWPILDFIVQIRPFLIPWDILWTFLKTSKNWFPDKNVTMTPVR